MKERIDKENPREIPPENRDKKKGRRHPWIDGDRENFREISKKKRGRKKP